MKINGVVFLFCFALAGSLLQVSGPDVPPRNTTMNRLNGRLGTTSSHHRAAAADLDGDFEPSCLVRTPSGSVYIPPGSGIYDVYTVCANDEVKVAYYVCLKLRER